MSVKIRHLLILFFAGYGIGTMLGRGLAAPPEPAPEPVAQAHPPAVREPAGGPRDQIRAWVDERLAERLSPTDEEIEAAARDAISGNPRSMSADKGAGGGMLAMAIARVAWKVLKVAVAALLLGAIGALIWSHWYYLAAGAAALAGWIEWRARSAASREARRK